MFSKTNLLALSLLGLASAAPTARRQDSNPGVPAYPTPSTSKGFTLIVNVTDASKDFTPSINNYVFSTAHIGAGEDLAVVAPSSPGPIFYQNGTFEKYAPYNTLTDAGTPPAPYGIFVQAEDQFDYTYPNEHDVYVGVGAATPYVGIAAFPQPVAFLTGGHNGRYVVCNNTVPYYNRNLLTVQFAYETYEEVDGQFVIEHNIPDGCAPVNFVAQCATLPDLPEGSYSSHEYAQTVECYEDVASIVWTENNGGY